MSWTRLDAKKAREEMGRDAEYDFDPADIARQTADEIPDMDRNLPVSTPVAIPEDDESLVPPNGIIVEVALGVRYSTEEFYLDFPSERVWRTWKWNIRDRCTNAFLKKNWEAWRKQAQPRYVPPKAEVRKSYLHYAGLELHGLKVDWSMVDLSIAMNTISKERRHAARRELC
ncbi:hypothetical protein R1sor_012010 [Riccia sorocarpa]|uniref:Transposase n=1 Tax=Riccia sorocarpa TaxID=122646 RepID=A0ABD3I5X9_9MARC